MQFVNFLSDLKIFLLGNKMTQIIIVVDKKPHEKNSYKPQKRRI